MQYNCTIYASFTFEYKSVVHYENSFNSHLEFDLYSLNGACCGLVAVWSGSGHIGRAWCLETRPSS